MSPELTIVGSHMVPILNKIGTDVACVGVSDPLFVVFASSDR